MRSLSFTSPHQNPVRTSCPPYYIILCYIMLYYIILYYVILYYIILCYIILYVYTHIYVDGFNGSEYLHCGPELRHRAAWYVDINLLVHLHNTLLCHNHTFYSPPTINTNTTVIQTTHLLVLTHNSSKIHQSSVPTS
jgi:hypothetical protein